MYWRKFELLYFHTINNSREHKLLVITEQGELEVDSFSLPSACACYLRKDFNNLEFRSGTKNDNRDN